MQDDALVVKLAQEQKRARAEPLTVRPASLSPEPWPGLEEKPNALGGYVCKDCGATIKGKLQHAWTCSYWDTPAGKMASPF